MSIKFLYTFVRRSAHVLVRPTTASIAQQMANCTSSRNAIIMIALCTAVANGRHHMIAVVYHAVMYSVIYSVTVSKLSRCTTGTNAMLNALALIAPVYIIIAFVPVPFIGVGVSWWFTYVATRAAVGSTAGLKIIVIAIVVASTATTIVGIFI